MIWFRPFAILIFAAIGVFIVFMPRDGRAAPEPRLALVIGNANYGKAIGDLRNPVNDARLLERSLTKVGFQVIRFENANRRQIRDAIAAFGKRLVAAGPTAVGMFYFAGHGFQVKGQNWLVPVGAVINNEADVEDEAVRAEYVLQQMDIARNQLNIVILDACRDNPFSRSFRSNVRGLAPVQASQNSVVGYATAPGDVAADGDGANSPYAIALSEEITTSTERIEIVMTNVTGRVKRATGNKQQPYVSSTLDRAFRFREPATGGPTKPVSPPPSSSSAPGPQAPAGRPGVSQDEQELEAWKSLGPNPTIEELEAFLRAFPNGKFAGIARARLQKLRESAKKPAGGSGGAAPPSSTGGGGGNLVAGQTFRDCAQCPEMVVVPAGSFVMGSPAGEEGRSDDEGPQHRVTISRDFAVGKFEVTFAEWDACVAGGGCNGYRPDDRSWGRNARPVINVSWNDAQAYVAWLSNRSGKRYRLLSEAEWEYAARAGTTTAYPWGNTASHEYANYGTDKCCDGLAQGRDQWVNTSPAGSFPANRFGLHDMHGNVWEWTEDCYNSSYDGAPSDGRAWTSGNCSARVLRGGSWDINPQVLRSANRDLSSPTVRYDNDGFRVARTL